jgi:hypothetical protein
LAAVTVPGGREPRVRALAAAIRSGFNMLS